MSNEVDLRKQRKVDANVSIDTTGLATEAKQDDIITAIDNITIDTTGISTEAKQDAQITQLTTLLANTTGLSVEATQLLVKGVLDAIKLKTDNIDVALSTRLKASDTLTKVTTVDTITNVVSVSATALPLPTGASTEATLIQIRDYVDTLESIVSGLNTKGGNATVATVSQAIVSTLLLSSNVNRKEVIIQNTSSKNLWISFVSPAVVGKGFKLVKDEQLIDDIYFGGIYGIWDGAGADNAQITEVTT